MPFLGLKILKVWVRVPPPLLGKTLQSSRKRVLAGNLVALRSASPGTRPETHSFRTAGCAGVPPGAIGEARRKIPHSVVRAVCVPDFMEPVLPVDVRGKFGKCCALGLFM